MSSNNDNYYENYKKSLENNGNISKNNENTSSSNHFLMPLGLVALGVAGYLGYTMYPTPSSTPFKSQDKEQMMFSDSIHVEKKALETLSKKVVVHEKENVSEQLVLKDKKDKDVNPVSLTSIEMPNAKTTSIVKKEKIEKAKIEKEEVVKQAKKTEEKVENLKKIEERKKPVVKVIPKVDTPKVEKIDVVEKKIIKKEIPTHVKKKEILPAAETLSQVNLNHSKKDEKALLDILSQSQVDSVKPSTVKTAENVSADKHKKVKKKNIDTYNKVVSVKSNANDELSKLSQLMSDAIKTTSANVNEKESSNTYITSIKKEVATRVNEMTIIIVKKGDTLGSLALKAYGNVMHYPKIFSANSDILEDPNKLSIGQKIRIPQEIVQKEEAQKSETTS